MSEWIELYNGTQIHRTALIAPWVRFDDMCIVHPYAIVGRYPNRSASLARQPENTVTNVIEIGVGTTIGCHAVIYANVKIGNECLVGDGANIREGARIGNRCVIGSNVSISYNVVIGDECRFQNGTVIVGDIHIGDGCFFGVNVTTSNDRNVDLENYHFPNPPQPSLFGKKVMIGSGSNILAGCKIGDETVIGAGALVVCDIGKGEIYLSKPAKEYIK